MPDRWKVARGSLPVQAAQGRLAAHAGRVGRAGQPAARSRNLNAVPRGSLSSTQIRPPWASAASRQKTRPSPRLVRSEEHTSELQSHLNLVCRLLLEKKKNAATALSSSLH